MKTNKAWQGHFFEDFKLGQKISCPTPRCIQSGETALYIALTGDRTPRYCNASGLVHPLVSFHTVFAQTVRSISLNAKANLGYAEVRWLAPVYLKDTLSIELEIVGLKENSSRDTGIVYVKNLAKNQEGLAVLSFYRWVMVKKKESTQETPYLQNPVLPKLPSAISPEHLLVVPEAIPSQRETGGNWLFEDYQLGERIFHYDGMTVNSSDHMSFTRLFQNSAKVHFDALQTDGNPLVYGGVPISLGYSMAFNGLENRLGLVGINAGSHVNPVHAGDTLYAFTEVIGKSPTQNSGVGALRLRQIVLKNLDPTGESDTMTFAIQSEIPNKPNKMQYHPNIVLDLDYWELIPTRFK